MDECVFHNMELNDSMEALNGSNISESNVRISEEEQSLLVDENGNENENRDENGNKNESLDENGNRNENQDESGNENENENLMITSASTYKVDHDRETIYSDLYGKDEQQVTLPEQLKSDTETMDPKSLNCELEILSQLSASTLSSCMGECVFHNMELNDSMETLNGSNISESNVRISEEEQLLLVDENGNENENRDENGNENESLDENGNRNENQDESGNENENENLMITSASTYKVDHDGETIYSDSYGKDEQQVTLPEQLKSDTETMDPKSLNCELLNEPKSNVSKIFTIAEEISLLNNIEKDKANFCICKSCVIIRLRYLAYYTAYYNKKPYPKSWRNKQADSKWLIKFEKRHEKRIAKFPLVCTLGLSQVLNQQQSLNEKILTPQKKQSLLTDEKCVMTKMLSPDYNLDDDEKRVDE